ncbi:HNH endonuclease [Lactiplantibacillus pentosus]
MDARLDKWMKHRAKRKRRKQHAKNKKMPRSHLRQQVLERDHYLCAYCKSQGVITPAKTVDHVVPIEFDETLKANIDNLAVICGSCHRAKTDWEQSYYGTGQGNELQRQVDEITDVSTINVLMNGGTQHD